MPKHNTLLLTIIFIIQISPQCMIDYQYADSNTGYCLPCHYNCKTCYDSTYCLQCMSQYYLTAANTCQQCSFGCQICLNSFSCSSCNVGLYLTNNGDCAVCATGVATCTIATIQTCQDNYFLLASICAGCFTNCKTCSDFVTCSQCDLAYYLSPNATTCLSCPANCQMCSNSSSCTYCDQGYTQNGNGCTLFVCNSFDPFCMSCSSTVCLSCIQGKYLSGGVCKQGGSLLCISSTGAHHTDCETSDSGCAPYADSQVDENGNLLSVCLPKSATKLYEFIFIEQLPLTCSGSCGQSSIQSLSYLSRQAYYKLNLFINIKFYSTTASRTFTIALTDQNGSIIQSTILHVDITSELSAFSDSDINCSNCPFSQKIITASFAYSGGQYHTNLSFSDTNGLFKITEIMLQHSICQVQKCSNCSSAVDCYSCFSPYLLQLTSCVQVCDAGFYLLGSTCYLQCPVGSYTLSSSYSCQTCVSPCKTCFDALTCMTCVQGYYLQGVYCLSACSSTYLFPNSTSNKCETCPNPCITCQIINNTVSCLSCAQGYLFNGTSCVFFCPWGEYGNFINGISQCSSCDSSCSQCYINSSICLSCTSGFLLLQSSCLALSQCPASFYQNTVYHQCITCHYPCSSCSNSPTQCNSCIRGALFNNKCLNQCPLGYFPNYNLSQNITCDLCQFPCSNCLSSTSCTYCASGYYLYQTQCLSACPAMYYQMVSNLSCVSCIPPCKTCINQTGCLSCSTGYLDNITCTLDCNSTSYINQLFQCTLCTSPCLNCYSNTYCLQCQLPYYLYNHSCITLSQCSSLFGYYANNLPNQTLTIYSVCSKCTFPCTSCVNTSVTCLTCQTGYYFVATMHKCVTICPSSYFINVNNCVVCDSNCYQCSQVSVNCTQCSAGIYLFRINSTCVNSCPKQYYGDDSSQSCAPCLFPCLQCYNAYLCYSCASGILYSKQCTSSCPTTTYHNTTINQCVSCMNNCLTCGSSPNSCLTCSNGYFLYNISCLSVCPTLYYANEYTRLCQGCSFPCYNCSAVSVCIDCVVGFYFYNSQCLTACPTSSYSDNSTHQCVSCNLTICLTCQNNANNCLTCNSNYFYYNKSCIDICPNSTFPNTISGTCDSCPFPCSSCSSYSYCSSCLSSYYLFSNRCFSQCPIGYYADNSSVCLICSINCQICLSPIVCIACKTNYYIYNSTCWSSCPLGYYTGLQAITNYDCCQACQSSCVNCSSYDYCLVCAYPLIQFNGICLSDCPIFYFAVNTTNSFCSQCSNYCTKCINQTYCLSCIGTYLYQNQCIVACPSQTYSYLGKSCNLCKQPCFNCSGDFTCLTCIQGYIYFHQYCLTSCPSDVWYYPNNNTCNVNCPYNKLSSNMTCYIDICGSTMVSLNGYCLQECSSGYYVNTNQQCIACSSNPSLCKQLFIGDLQILYIDVLTLSLYLSQKAQMANPKDISITFVDIDSNPISYNYSSYEITQNKIQFKFDYKSIELVNITLQIPYIKSQSTAQCISSNYFKKQLTIYYDYSQHQTNTVVSFIPTILIIILFAIVVVNVCNKNSHFTQIMDYTQMVAVTLYLNIQYPPILQSFLSGFKLSLLALTKNMIDSTPYSFSPPKFIFYHIDTSLFRNQLMLLLAFLIGLVLFVIVISVNSYDKRRFSSSIKVIRYRLINDLFSICITPLFLFACQISHANTMNLLAAVVLGLIGISYVGWISYKIVNVKKLQELTGLLGDFQRTQSKLGLMYTPFAFIRRIVFTFGLGIAPFSPISTLTLLLVLTFLIMICIYFYQPFDNQYTDYVTIFMESSLTIYVICLIIFALDAFSAESSHNLGVFAVGLITTTEVIALGWLIYLTIADIRVKGCCPKAIEQTIDLSQLKNDYSQNKSEKSKKEQEGPLEQAEVQKQEENHESSAYQFLHRLGSKIDDLESKSNQNEQFKHWSDQSSQKDEPFSKKQVNLPQLLIKKEVNPNP